MYSTIYYKEFKLIYHKPSKSLRIYDIHGLIYDLMYYDKEHSIKRAKEIIDSWEKSEKDKIPRISGNDKENNCVGTPSR